MDGILIIDKPEGYTSHDVVARLRRILKTKRVGHTGTLDPFATGVLVMLVGKATRLAQYLDKDAKEYEAVIRFGYSTDTGDRTGEPNRISDSGLHIPDSEFQISDEQIEEALASFRGEIEQTPPMYSAKKVDGVKLYELARQGIEIERKAVKVTIYNLEIISPPKLVKTVEEKKSEVGSQKSEVRGRKSEINNPKSEAEDEKSETQNLESGIWNLESEVWNLESEIKVLCSAGTYIRTLAENIGGKLGIGAHLAELRRTKAGKFDLSKAVTIEALEAIVAENRLPDVLVSMNEAVSHLSPIVLSAKEVEDAKNGKRQRLENSDFSDHQTVRMIDEADNLIAVGFYLAKEKSIQPKLVLL